MSAPKSKCPNCGEYTYAAHDVSDCLAARDAEIASLRLRYREALVMLGELVEVAGLRGDNVLPHPANDSKLWTARMQTAWDEAEMFLARPEAQAALKEGQS